VESASYLRDIIIFPQLNELQETLLELKIYFDDDYHKSFEQLTKGFQSINEKLMNLYFNSIPDLNLVKAGNDFNRFKDEVLNKNEVIMNELCLKIRATFE
jgi:hypothetical protein